MTLGSFKSQGKVAETPRARFQRGQELAGDTPPAPRRLHEHSLDLPDARFQLTNRSATNRLAISVSDQKSQSTILDVFWMKTVNRDAGIATMQVRIEGLNEDSGIL